MMPSLVCLLLVQLLAVMADANIKSHFASLDRSGDLMRVLSVTDVSDRNMNTWWDQFSISWAEYDLKVKDDPNLYCSSPNALLTELGELKSKVELVVTGLEAKEEQLLQIRNLLENTEIGGKSGLHCKDDPEQAICKALDGLDKKTADERTRLMAEVKKVTDEISKVENHPCDCTYNAWAENWGACSVTCDVGIKEETRQIKWNKRNAGKDCNPNDAKRTDTCNDGCCPKDCVWDKWGAWSACPEILTSEPQFEYAHRSILVEHECSERGGLACVGETKKSRKCNILTIKNDILADKEEEIQSLRDELKGLKEGCNVVADAASSKPPPKTTTSEAGGSYTKVGGKMCVQTGGGRSLGVSSLSNAEIVCNQNPKCKGYQTLVQPNMVKLCSQEADLLNKKLTDVFLKPV